MCRPAKEIIADLRDIASVHDAKIGDILREAADRLESASAVPTRESVRVAFDGSSLYVIALKATLNNVGSCAAFGMGALWQAVRVANGSIERLE